MKQLKDLIQDMYVQKQKYDEKCVETRLPRETMEQYMYTYLNQRYGLKNLIIEWAAALINGIKRYSAEDSDVALFGKILRNECDEDFRFVYAEVKATLLEVVRERLKLKHRHKTEGEIAKMLADIQAGDLDESQWLHAIKKMYNEEHARTLERKVREKVGEQGQRLRHTDSRKRTREEQLAMQSKKDSAIRFADFQKVLSVSLLS